MEALLSVLSTIVAGLDILSVRKDAAMDTQPLTEHLISSFPQPVNILLPTPWAGDVFPVFLQRFTASSAESVCFSAVVSLLLYECATRHVPSSFRI